jgi:hypothetical protein
MFIVLDSLSENQIEQLKLYVDLEEQLSKHQQELQPILEQQKPSEIYSWSRNMAFGAIPFDIIDLIRQHNDDYIIKLRCIDDLDYIFESL